MKIMQLMKADLAEHRNKVAATYREIRREDPAKARFLFKRMTMANAMLERQLMDNLYHQSRPVFLN